MRSLRFRLMISHILPLLVVVPLVGAALVYLLETQVLLEAVSSNFTRQAVLVAEIASENPVVLADPAAADLFVSRIQPQLNAQLTLLDPDGVILASSTHDSQHAAGQTLVPQGWDIAKSGEIHVHVEPGFFFQTQTAQVLVPIVDPDGKIAGVVMLTNPVTPSNDDFQRVRYLVFGVLAVGLAFGAALGLSLAAQLANPIRRTTEAVKALSDGRSNSPIPERGPQEIQDLVRAFNTLSSRLRDMEQNRKRLLANLTHEMGRPLGALLSGIQALQGGADCDTPLRQELLDGIAGEVLLMRRLLDEIAHLYTQTIGPLELERREVALSEWLPRMLAPWRESAQAKHLAWQAELAEELPRVQMDPERMDQALGNLLSNAIKFTTHGSITFSASASGNELRMVIRDTGRGISPEELPRIFHPFYRSRAVERFPQGMGLGLSIAHDIVAAHGGTLEAQSQTGEGASFTVRIPLAPISAPNTDSP